MNIVFRSYYQQNHSRITPSFESTSLVSLSQWNWCIWCIFDKFVWSFRDPLSGSHMLFFFPSQSCDATVIAWLFMAFHLDFFIIEWCTTEQQSTYSTPIETTLTRVRAALGGRCSFRPVHFVRFDSRRIDSQILSFFL